MRHGFRPDVQGLRALAVLLVAADHAGIGPFHGGFVGVDVFFVISGFLITGLLLREADRDRRVSLTNFYARRARRILPAATVVLLATVAGSLLLLSAVEASAAVEDAVWATFFAANIKLTIDGTDYFNAEAAASPFQHYWSLAVEEQFYLVWPVLVLVLAVLAARSSRSLRGVVVAALGVLVVASFAWSVIQTQDNTVAAYFSPLTRAWELGLGALAACLVPLVQRWAAGRGSGALAAISWVGLGAVLVAALAYDEQTLFPGYAAALPVIGTAALLLGGLGGSVRGPQPLLSLRPVRAIGDWSYSLYLWHWPLLIFAAAIWGTPSGWYGLAVIGVATVMSALTYRFVENPVREGRWFTARTARGMVLYPAVVAITLPLMAGANVLVNRSVGDGGGAITTSDFGQGAGDPKPDFSKDPVVALVEASVLAAENGAPIPGDLKPPLLDLDDDRPPVGDCEYFAINEDRPLCPRGDLDGDRTLILIGDSHARQWIPALDALAQRFGYRAFWLVREGCPASDVTPWLNNGTGPQTKCADFQDWAVEQVEAMQPDVVVLGSQANSQGFEGPDGEHVTDLEERMALYRSGMTAQVRRLEPHAERIVLIGDPPDLTFDPGRCLSERDATLASCLSEGDPTSVRFAQALRQGAVAAGAEYVATGQWFCVRDKCPTVIGDYIARRDMAHTSVSYAAYLTDALEERLRLGP